MEMHVKLQQGNLTVRKQISVAKQALKLDSASTAAAGIAVPAALLVVVPVHRQIVHGGGAKPQPILLRVQRVLPCCRIEPFGCCAQPVKDEVCAITALQQPVGGCHLRAKCRADDCIGVEDELGCKHASACAAKFSTAIPVEECAAKVLAHLLQLRVRVRHHSRAVGGLDSVRRDCGQVIKRLRSEPHKRWPILHEGGDLTSCCRQCMTAHWVWRCTGTDVGTQL